MQYRSALDDYSASVSRLVNTIDVWSLSGADAVVVLDRLCGSFRQLHALRDAVALRCVTTNQNGASKASSWLAGRLGVLEKDAGLLLWLQKRLPLYPDVESAVLSGSLSLEKAVVIVRGSAERDSVCQELLTMASSASVEELKARVREINQRGKTSRSRLRDSQYIRVGSDGDNMVLGQFKLLPELVGAFLARKEQYEREALVANAKLDSPLPVNVVKAEVFARVLSESGGSSSSAVVNFHVDMTAFDRGFTEAGERCEIAGIGPVPVSVIKELADDPVRRIILTCKNKLVGYFEESARDRNKPLPDYVKRAIKAFGYGWCSADGCVNPARDVDHIVASTNGGGDDIPNLQGLCKPCHDAKTKKDAPWTAAKFYAPPIPDVPLRDTG